MKFTKTLKARWISALRSGKYKQGRGRLKKTDNREGRYTRHCCLGVLADITGLKTVNSFDLSDRPRGAAKETPGVMSLIKGLSRGEQSVLMSKNDTGATFKQIASYIDKNL